MPSKDLVMPNEDEDENISMYQNYPLTQNPSTLLHSSIFGKIQTKKLDLQDLIRMKNKIQNEKQIRDLKVSEEDMKTSMSNGVNSESNHSPSEYTKTPEKPKEEEPEYAILPTKQKMGRIDKKLLHQQRQEIEQNNNGNKNEEADSTQHETTGLLSQSNIDSTIKLDNTDKNKSKAKENEKEQSKDPIEFRAKMLSVRYQNIERFRRENP